MNFKTFEYKRDDIKMLNKDSTLRLIFIALMGVVLVWQVYSLTLAIKDKSLNIGKLISVCAVCFIGIVMLIYSISTIVRNMRIVNVVNTKGRCASSVSMLFDPSKTGILNLYSILSKVVAALSLVVLACSLTTLALQANVTYSISFYLPLLVSLCLISLYSVHQVQHEVKIAKTVDEFNKIY